MCVCVREREREKERKREEDGDARKTQAEDFYIDPKLFSCVVPYSYSGPHLALLLLRALPGQSLVFSRLLDCPTEYPRLRLETETDRLRHTVTVVGVCKYHFATLMHFRLSTHVIRFRLPTRVSYLHPRIAVNLFTQPEHDSPVKGQYTTVILSNFVTIGPI